GDPGNDAGSRPAASRHHTPGSDTSDDPPDDLVHLPSGRGPAGDPPDRESADDQADTPPAGGTPTDPSTRADTTGPNVHRPRSGPRAPSGLPDITVTDGDTTYEIWLAA
ncbi:MAG: hypothetical protein JXA83_13140, partial [Acidimicrobiales bacterium]|nr:hypothetical protein [Acidimicrobiales bacterium]